MTASYVPEAGDIVWLHFDPQAGHEQAGHLPALVLSPGRYNGPRGMMVCCPMTSRIKGYPFEVVDSLDPSSAVLADQVENLDWRARREKGRGVDHGLSRGSGEDTGVASTVTWLASRPAHGMTGR